MYIISACLMGCHCKYNGGSNLNEDVVNFAKGRAVCMVCPESAGGLVHPRKPAERIEDRIINSEGEDLTEAFLKGAELSFDYAKRCAEIAGEEIEGAILKANSPSCGYGRVYDGTFSGTKVEGDGCFGEILRREGIPVINEKDI